MARLTVCADDFGLKPEIDEAAIALVSAGRLNAVSVMALETLGEESADRLAEAASNAPCPVEIGLHITLTQYQPLTTLPGVTPDGMMPSIRDMLFAALRGALNHAQLTAEIEAQYDRFCAMFSRPPDYLDGHEHCHTLPRLGAEVTRIAKDKGPSLKWVRQCSVPLFDIMKTRNARLRASIVKILSDRFKAELAKARLSSNDRFLGVIDQVAAEEFPVSMARFLKLAARRDDWTVIMCHPAIEDLSGDAVIFDPIAERRPAEFSYLSSDRFLQDMASVGLKLS
ncbi:MAG: ChbG/HpnK family deacetylase [Pseudomonadota bacterium]